jgi:hypothetical protein
MAELFRSCDNGGMKEIKLSDNKAPLKRGGYYPIYAGDYGFCSELPRNLQVPHGLVYDPATRLIHTTDGKKVSVFAQYRGEKRPPRKGEFYLSGAFIEAYRAPNNLSTPYHIAHLVYVVQETITRTYEVS